MSLSFQSQSYALRFWHLPRYDEEVEGTTIRKYRDVSYYFSLRFTHMILNNNVSLEYSAPESLPSPITGILKETDSKADMWSLGMILHKLLFFKLPYRCVFGSFHLCSIVASFLSCYTGTQLPGMPMASPSVERRKATRWNG